MKLRTQFHFIELEKQCHENDTGGLRRMPRTRPTGPAPWKDQRQQHFIKLWEWFGFTCIVNPQSSSLPSTWDEAHSDPYPHSLQ